MLWTTPKTLDKEWRNRLKELRIRSGLHSRKVELSCKILSRLCWHSQLCLSHRYKQGGLDRQLSTCLTTNYKKRINSRQSGIFTTSFTGLYDAICYLFKKHQLNSKSDGPVLLFKTLFWYWYCFPSSFAMGCKDWKWIESDEEGDIEVVYGRTCMTSSGRSVRDHHWCP